MSPDQLLLTSAFGDKDDFLRLVTFHKLDTPLDNTLYSLQGSRTAFYPHQYKPLLKFLDSPEQRLLIADEVGLGKTIEAGLVMIEQRARRALRRVLVICAAALCGKWREEMWHRFDEEFKIIGAAEFREQLQRLAQQGDLGEARDIISPQAIRNEEHIELVKGGRPSPDSVSGPAAADGSGSGRPSPADRTSTASHPCGRETRSISIRTASSASPCQ